jgi:hypothetical protein
MSLVWNSEAHPDRRLVVWFDSSGSAGLLAGRRSRERLCHRLKESQAAAGHKVVTENQFGKESDVVAVPVALCVPARLEAVGDR